MAPTANWIAWAAQPRAQKVTAVTLTPMKVANSSALALYFSDVGGIWDGSNYWEPYVASVPSISQTADSIVYGKTLPSYGGLELTIQRDITVDPAGAVTWNQLLAPGAYAFYGQPVEVKIGGPDLAWADWATVVSGYMGQPAFDDAKVTIPIFTEAQATTQKQVPPKCYGDSGDFPAFVASAAYALGQLVRPTTPTGDYFHEVTTAGTAGAEPAWSTTPGNTTASGGVTFTCRQLPSSTIGKPKPLAYGELKNITPALIDEASFLYQYLDDSYGPANSVDAAYINGATTATGTANLTYGTIRFSGKPAQAPTLDIKGRKVGGVYKNLPGDIASDLLQTFGGVSAGALVAADFTAFNTDVPYPVGLYLDSKTTLASALDSLFTGLLSFWGNTRDGLWTIKRFQPASGSAVVSVSDIEHLDWSAAPEADIFWKASIRGNRNWTVNGNPDTAITQDLKTWLADQYRERSHEDSSIKTPYPKAGEAGPHDSFLVSLDDAAAVAGWWLDIFGTQRLTVGLETKLQPLTVALGDVVEITRDRFGFDAGVLGRTVSIEETYGEQYRVKLGVLI